MQKCIALSTINKMSVDLTNEPLKDGDMGRYSHLLGHKRPIRTPGVKKSLRICILLVYFKI